MRKDDYERKNGVNKPTRKQGEVGKDNAEFRGYINVNLSDEEKARYSAWGQSASVWEALEFQVADGVNLSLKREKGGESFLASATQRRADSPNAGLCVTARGRDAATAWGRVLFILTILSKAERWEDTQPMADPDRW